MPHRFLAWANRWFQGLLVVYVAVVVLLVRRQLSKVNDEEEIDKVAMIDKDGKTDVMNAYEVFDDDEIILL